MLPSAAATGACRSMGTTPRVLAEKASEWRRAAMQHIQAGSYSRALDAARKAASLLPGDAQLAALVEVLSEKVALSSSSSACDSGESASASSGESTSDSGASSSGDDSTSSSASGNDTDSAPGSENGSVAAEATPAPEHTVAQDAIAERARLLAAAAEQLQLQGGAAAPQCGAQVPAARSRQQLRAALQGQLQQLRKVQAGQSV